MKASLKTYKLIVFAMLLPTAAIADFSVKPVIQDNCDNGYDFSVDVSEHPLAYKNPDLAGCDLGFELPGLPSIGGSLKNLDSCEILKKITGTTVSKFNKEMQGAIDEGIKGVTGGNKNVQENWDLNKLLIENLNIPGTNK